VSVDVQKMMCIRSIEQYHTIREAHYSHHATHFHLDSFYARTLLAYQSTHTGSHPSLRTQKSLLPTTLQLTIPASRNRRVVRLQHPRLTLIRLTKRIPTLLAHTLNLSNLTNRLLKLFHPASRLADVPQNPQREHTSVYNPEYYTFESPGHDDTPEGSTCAWHTSRQSL
jgi:hypothetical protein